MAADGVSETSISATKLGKEGLQHCRDIMIGTAVAVSRACFDGCSVGAALPVRVQGNGRSQANVPVCMQQKPEAMAACAALCL